MKTVFSHTISDRNKLATRIHNSVKQTLNPSKVESIL